MVTYLRVKLKVSSRKAEGKGMDMLMRKLKQENNEHEISKLERLKEEIPRKVNQIQREIDERLVQIK